MHDAWLLVELPVLASLSHVLPIRSWNGLSRAIESMNPACGAELAAGLAAYGPGPPLDRENARVLARGINAARTEHWIEVLNAWRPFNLPPRYRVRTRLHGAPVLADALAGGKGAVLWIAHFAFAPLASKAALADAGYRVWHLSRPEHGFSKTRFGIAVFNPIRWRVEERYLAGRLLIDRRNPSVVMRRAVRLLADNAVVSITAGAWEGARVLKVPVGRARLGLSSGAPSLAHMSGAALIPVIATRPNAGAPVDVTICEPLEANRALPRGAWADATTLQFIERTLSAVDRHPAQWRDWGRLEAAEDASIEQGPTSDAT